MRSVFFSVALLATLVVVALCPGTASARHRNRVYYAPIYYYDTPSVATGQTTTPRIAYYDGPAVTVTPVYGEVFMGRHVPRRWR